MPLDPNILLGVRPPQIESPMTTLSQILQMRTMQDEQKRRDQQDQIATLQVQDLERQQSEEAAYRDATKKNTDLKTGDTDWMGVERELLGKGLIDSAKKARAEHDTIIKNQNADAKAANEDLKERLALAKPQFQAALDVYDPDDPGTLPKAQALYETALARAKDVFSNTTTVNGQPTKAPTPMSTWLDQMPKQFDPAYVNQLLDAGEKVDDVIKRQNWALDRLDKAADIKSKGAKATTEQRQALASALAATHSQKEWDQILQHAPSQRIPQDIIDEFPKEWSKDSVDEASQKSMMPKDWMAAQDRSQRITDQEAVADANAAARRASLDLAYERLKNAQGKASADDPKMPRGVADAIVQQNFKDDPSNGKTAVEQAKQWLTDNSGALRKDHPSLDLGKAEDFVKKVYGGSAKDAYNAMMGLGTPDTSSTPTKPAPPPVQPPPAAPVQAPAASGPAAPAAQQNVKVGQKVKLRNGKIVTVTAVHPDGTFDAK